MSWSVRAALGETGRSLSCRPFATLLVGFIVAGSALAAGALDMLAWRDDAKLAASQEAAGSLVIRASAAGESASIETAACLALNRADGVRAAGGIGAGGLEYAGTSPGLGFRVLPAAGRIASALTGATLAAQQSGAGLIVADDVAQQVGLAPGSWTVVHGTRTRVSAVLPLGQRDPQLGRVALNVAAPPDVLTACYVEFADDYALRTLAAQLPTVFAATTDLRLVRLFATGDGTPDPARLWETRPTRNLAAALGLLTALVYLIVSRSRRQEYSIYLVTGSSRAQVAFLVLLGGYAVVAAGTAVAAAWLALLARAWDVPGFGWQLGVLAAAHTGIVAMALLPLSLTWLMRANLHRLLRERVG